MTEIRVLHFSSHDEDCGVAKYQENYLVGMQGMTCVSNQFFDSSPYITREMTSAELEPVLSRLRKDLENYDVLHVQHEFGLYRHEEFSKIVDAAKSMGKKVVITVHLSPGFAIKRKRLPITGVRSLLVTLRDRRHYRRMVAYHIEPMRKADAVIAHNDVTVQSLRDFGIAADRIHKLIHPVYTVPSPQKTTEISDALRKESGDVIFCITGFLHRYKGILGAIRALKFLPENYKLALIGGVKADSDQVNFEDKITDLVDTLGLRGRVYITGFVPDDDRLNSLIRECDVCVYPYDGVYYSSLSSGSLNLALANSKPVLAYPTETFKEAARDSNGAVVLTQVFAYYELARELQKLDIAQQTELSKLYAEKMAWPKMSAQLVDLYGELLDN